MAVVVLPRNAVGPTRVRGQGPVAKRDHVPGGPLAVVGPEVVGLRENDHFGRFGHSEQIVWVRDGLERPHERDTCTEAIGNCCWGCEGGRTGALLGESGIYLGRWGWPGGISAGTPAP